MVAYTLCKYVRFLKKRIVKQIILKVVLINNSKKVNKQLAKAIKEIQFIGK